MYKWTFKGQFRRRDFLTDSKAAFILFHIYTENPTLTILFFAMLCKFISWSINFIILASSSFQELCIPYFFLPLFFICFLYFPIDSVLLPFHTYLWSRMSKATESVIPPCTRMWILRKYLLLEMTSNWFDKRTISYYNNSYYTLHALNILIRKFGSWTCSGNTETCEYFSAITDSAKLSNRWKDRIVWTVCN